MEDLVEEEDTEVVHEVVDKCPEDGLLVGSNSAPSTTKITSKNVATYATDLGTLQMSASRPNRKTRAGEEIWDSVPRDLGVEDPTNKW